MEQREENSNQDKTEEATDEKRNQFREEGHVANPREIVAGSILVVFTIYFYLYGSSLIKNFSITFERAWYNTRPQDLNFDNFMDIIYYSTSPLIQNIIFIFLFCIFFPLLIGLIFTRFNFSTKKITFNLEKINPIQGFARIFGSSAFIEITKVLIKFISLSLVIFFVIKTKISNSHELYFVNHIIFLSRMGDSLLLLFFSMALSVVIVGIGEFAFNLWKIEKELKMSKQELKEDLKKSEGDPQIKSRRKRLARDLAYRKSLKDVPKSTFIVTNPEHFAVAIRYLRGMNAPIVVAKGQDLMAFKIREIAKKHDIIIVENKPLARTLYKAVKIGQEIPPSLYQAIIEVMKYIYKIRGKNYFEKFAQSPVTI